MMAKWMSALVLLAGIGACQSAQPRPEPADQGKNDPDNIDPEAMRRYSKNLQQYIDAMLLCGSTLAADWEEAKRRFDVLHPFLVFKEDPDLIREFKAGSVAARKELARRGAILRSVLVFSSGPYDRGKWEEARKVLMDSGEAGQVLLAQTLLQMLLNGQNQEIWVHVRFALVESGPVALETTTGLAKELAAAVPAETAIFKQDDLVQVFMVLLSFGDAGRVHVEELSRSAKLNVRRSVARAIGESKDGSGLPTLLRLLRDPDWMVRMTAAKALGQLASVRSTAGPALVGHLSSERDGQVFRSTLRALGDLMYVESIPDLVKVLEVPSRDTIDAAMQSLYILTGEKFLRKEDWMTWYRTRYPEWLAKRKSKLGPK
jgi:hypothetical protein